MFPLSVSAAPFIELGIGKADGASCIANGTEGWCSQSPLGYAALGYEKKFMKNFSGSLEVEHWSSFEDRDYGLNIFSAKIKYTFGN